MIKTVLEALRESAQNEYLKSDSLAWLNQQKCQFKEHEFSLNVADDGSIEMILENGIKGVFHVMATTYIGRESQLDNIYIDARLINIKDLSPLDVDYFNKARIFVISYFQRSIAFLFFARMQDVTINILTKHIANFITSN